MKNYVSIIITYINGYEIVNSTALIHEVSGEAEAFGFWTLWEGLCEGLGLSEDDGTQVSEYYIQNGPQGVRELVLEVDSIGAHIPWEQTLEGRLDTMIEFEEVDEYTAAAALVYMSRPEVFEFFDSFARANA